jgi:sulfoxide reductase heme-binding subunit YedZ
MKIRRIIQVVSYYVIPVVLLLLTLLIRDGDLFESFGSISLYLLIAVMFIKPVVKILNIKLFMKLLLYRREVGLLTFWFFLFHAYGLIVSQNIGLSSLLNTGSFLFYGCVGGAMLVILAVTSNKISQKLLKKNWKRVQYLSYAALFFVLLHVSLVEGELWMFFLVGGLFIVLKIIEFKKIRLVGDR